MITPPTNSSLEILRRGAREPFATATVAEVDGHDLWLQDCSATIAEDTVVLRFWGADDSLWEGVVSVIPDGRVRDGKVAVRLAGSWTLAALRRAVRIPVGREPLALLTLGGDGAVIRTVSCGCLDLSSNGCRVAGTGTPPHAGDLIQVESDRLSRPIDARVVRAGQLPYGSWEAGIEFLPHDSIEVGALLAWRDSTR